MKRKKTRFMAILLGAVLSGSGAGSAVYGQTLEGAESIEEFQEAGSGFTAEGEASEIQEGTEWFLPEEGYGEEQQKPESSWEIPEDSVFDDGEKEEEFSDGENGSPMFTEGDTKGSEIVLDVQDGQDITDALNSGLLTAKSRGNEENPCTVVIPPGSYGVTDTIHMFSNTSIYAVGATITKTSGNKHVILRCGYEDTNSQGGYEGYKNMTVEGGTWDANCYGCTENHLEGGYNTFRFGHAQNVTIKNAVFLNNNKSHFIELGGVKEALISGCTFRGYYEPYEGGGQEAVQIDAVWDGMFPTYQPFDGTVCEDIRIVNNVFENLLNGVGSHSMMFGRYYKNIEIKNNVFRNIKKRAVMLVNEQDTEVSGNRMENVGSGVYVRGMYTRNAHVMDQAPVLEQNQQPMNIVIANNTITMNPKTIIDGSQFSPAGICVTGEIVGENDKQIPPGIYRAKGMSITGNSIYGPGTGIKLYLTDQAAVSQNVIELTGEEGEKTNGIYLGSCDDNEITDNWIAGAQNAGICVSYGAEAEELPSCRNIVSGNTVERSGKNAVYVGAKSQDITVSDNRIHSAEKDGISVNRARTAAVMNNEVWDAERYGILINDNTWDCTVNNNEIYHIKKTGVRLYNSFVKSVNNNVIEGGKGTGIEVNATDLESLENNTVRDIRPGIIKTKNSILKDEGIRTVSLKTISAKKGEIAGTAKGAQVVRILNDSTGDFLGTAIVEEDGQFLKKVKKLKKGESLSLIFTDKEGNIADLTAEVK